MVHELDVWQVSAKSMNFSSDSQKRILIRGTILQRIHIGCRGEVLKMYELFGRSVVEDCVRPLKRVRRSLIT